MPYRIRSPNECRDIPNAIYEKVNTNIFNRDNCSFGGEILVKDELIFFSDMSGNRVHVIDVQKQKVSTS